MWSRTLAVVWTSQLLAILGYSFSIPFAPFYIQTMGVEEGPLLAHWVALFNAATPLSLALISPLWGAFADRYGRRLMLLRAYFAGAVVLVLMGLVRNVEALVLLRVLQGVFTGSVTAAQTFVTSQAPPERSGTTLGALSAAVFSGSLLGASLGGIFADRYGYRAAFFASAALVLASALLTLVLLITLVVRRIGAPVLAPREKRR